MLQAALAQKSNTAPRFGKTLQPQPLRQRSLAPVGNQAMLRFGVTRSSSPLQRKCACGSNGSACSCDSEAKLQRKAFAIESARLPDSVSRPDDPAEREADRVADTLLSGRGAVARPRPPIALRRPPSKPSVPGVSPVVNRVLDSTGLPLEAASRAFFEANTGIDLGHIRVHTDRDAQASAAAVRARAYTVGENIVFGAGQYQPSSETGQRLLAHELAHTLQQEVGKHPSHPSISTELQRQQDASVAVTSPAPPHVTPIYASAAEDTGQLPTVLSSLLDQIEDETERAISLRSEIDVLGPVSSTHRERLEEQLEGSRTNLIKLLQQRISLLEARVSSLQQQLGPNPISTADHPEVTQMGNEVNQLQSEIHKHHEQLRPLLRWQTRRQIDSLQGQIEQVDREILDAPPENPAAPMTDPSDPLIQKLTAHRAELEQERQRRAKSLTGSATGYKQGDSRWGNKRYGNSPECTNIAEAGCGPTSLAILLNYLFQEDPEQAAGGNLEIVLPSTTAEYAAINGRVCNNGTAGPTMVTNVETKWPGFRGFRLTLSQVVSELRSGNLVIFLCKGCSGQNSSGAVKTYGGHFMVLNTVNQDGTSFGVLDPAKGNLVSISRKELNTHTAGFWTVVRK